MLIAGQVDLHAVLASLALRRPLFHSEADFQLALAWEVHLLDPKMQVYVETRPAKGVRLDLAFERPDLGLYTAIELKYLTRAWEGTVEGQTYALSNQAAHDYGRYGVVRDIQRIERFTQLRPGSNGAVVTLTNDERYWNPSPNSTASDAAFRLTEGSVLEGQRDWTNLPASVKRQDSLHLRGNYQLHWSEFSTLDDGGRLRQLVVEVLPDLPVHAGDGVPPTQTNDTTNAKNAFAISTAYAKAKARAAEEGIPFNEVLLELLETYVKAPRY